jgi:hypothetical protein
MNAGAGLAEKIGEARHRADAGFGTFGRFGGFTRFSYLLPFDRGQIPTAKPNDQTPALTGLQPPHPHPRTEVLERAKRSTGYFRPEASLVHIGRKR